MSCSSRIALFLLSGDSCAPRLGQRSSMVRLSAPLVVFPDCWGAPLGTGMPLSWNRTRSVMARRIAVPQGLSGARWSAMSLPSLLALAIRAEQATSVAAASTPCASGGCPSVAMSMTPSA
eukprot:3479854-Pyramimonas_sp.AAC.1